MKLLTLNLGLFSLSLPFGWRIPFDQHVARRLAAAPDLLAKCGADVIALQEVFAASDRRFLTHALRETYPFSVGSPHRGSLIGNGLMILSRYPLSDTHFIPCRGIDWTHYFWHQGFLQAVVETPDFGKIRVMNVHLSASAGSEHQEAPGSMNGRTHEIASLMAGIEAGGGIDILIGDFNTGPQIAARNYEEILGAGFADAFVDVHGADALYGNTWDSNNPLNRGGRFRDSPSQRIDHVFLKTGSVSLRADAAAIILDGHYVTTRDGSVCLSDHYGMLVDLVAVNQTRKVGAGTEES